MRKFLIKASLFIFPSIPIFAIILGLANGYTDPFYIRFTTPKQTNLILGTSRAAQGLQPQVFKEVLNRDIYNYAFTIAHSPYGSTYLKSIEKKIKKDGQNRFFVLTVDPWSISSTTNNPNDSLNFRETSLCLANMPIVNMKPNYWYLINNFTESFKSILNNRNSAVFLHEDGWLEVNVNMDSISVNQRTNSKVESYENEYLPNFSFSSLRFEYLKKTILYLKQYGEVYLVRLPVHKRIIEIEQRLMPNFDSKISEITPLTNGYFDMTQNHDKYQYTDGNHLYKESAKVVSKEIAEWIKRNN